MFERNKKGEILKPQQASAREIRKYNARLEVIDWAERNVNWEAAQAIGESHGETSKNDYVFMSIQKKARKEGVPYPEISEIVQLIIDAKQRGL